MTTEKLPLPELAKRISAHLARFEKSAKINVLDPVYKTRPYYSAHAYAGPRDRYVRVVYVSYQGVSKLSRVDAERYLSWLDSGKVGKHWDCARERTGGG